MLSTTLYRDWMSMDRIDGTDMLTSSGKIGFVPIRFLALVNAKQPPHIKIKRLYIFLFVIRNRKIYSPWNYYHTTTMSSGFYDSIHLSELSSDTLLMRGKLMFQRSVFMD